jgi:hypothetical protein
MLDLTPRVRGSGLCACERLRLRLRLRPITCEPRWFESGRE